MNKSKDFHHNGVFIPMSVPKHSFRINPVTRTQMVNDLLESIALEKLALAYLINAEAEKMRIFTETSDIHPFFPSNQELVEYQRHTARIIEAFTEQQKILNRTLETVNEIINSDELKDKNDD
jgi:hypothetical protein